MFRRLDRYVVREMIPPFLMGAILVVALFQVSEYLNLRRMAGFERASAGEMIKLLALQTPSVLNFTLPISAALASAIAMSRLARESELTAMRSAGTKIVRVVWPMALFGLFIGVMNLLIIDRLAPAAAREATRIQNAKSGANAYERVTSNVSVKVEGRLVSIGTAVKELSGRVSLKDVLFLNETVKGTTALTTAKEGSYVDGRWEFLNCQAWKFIEGQPKPVYSKGFPVRLKQRVSVDDLFNPPEPDKLTIAELRDRITERRRLGQDTRQLEIEYQIKFSVPVMCLIFALVAPVFSILFARQGGFIGILVSLVVVLAYYNAWVVSTQILTKLSNIPPVAAAWMPNLIFLVIGLIGLRMIE